MQTITLRLDENTVESLDEEADKRDVTRSEYVRTIIDQRHEYKRLQSEHERITDKLQGKIDRLENEKQTLISDRQERQELVRYVEDERTWRQQPLTTRLRWWLFGQD